MWLSVYACVCSFGAQKWESFVENNRKLLLPQLPSVLIPKKKTNKVLQTFTQWLAGISISLFHTHSHSHSHVGGPFVSRRRMSYLLLLFCGKKSFLESPFREQNFTRKPSTTWDFKFTAIFRWVGHSGKKATVEPIPGALLARLKGSKTFIAHTHSLRKRKRERERERSFWSAAGTNEANSSGSI